ncbi:pseudouridine synthase [Nocardiopsis gilva YIM 90087]|uniref:Pseudouridine synthase n=1 Tax=Nocardiopsis gilva YIM 90087 TaxID=1235441 RepID=A0A223S5Y2_9ACTN|nr:pseudouridine synthase [Nocardiopsis gilva]ASU83522.1 pseudouridine synthase [Nocardiopsis gilva YIM 90087]
MNTPRNNSRSRGARDNAPRGERGDSYQPRGERGGSYRSGQRRDGQHNDRRQGGRSGGERGSFRRDDRGSHRSEGRDDRRGPAGNRRGDRDSSRSPERGERRGPGSYRRDDRPGSQRDDRRRDERGSFRRDDRRGKDSVRRGEGGRDRDDRRGSWRDDRDPAGSGARSDRRAFQRDDRRRDERGSFRRDDRRGKDSVRRGDGGRDRDDRRSDRPRTGSGGRGSQGDNRATGRGPAPRGNRAAAGGKPKAENQLSVAARMRLEALRSEYDPRDDDRADGPRDTYQDVPGGIRLQKALAQAGVASRRASEEMIVAGRVSVDGQTVRRFGARVDPETSEIRVDGMRVATAPDLLYFALNKPRGVVSTMWDPEGRPTLADYAGQTEERLFHVGRLDTETEGLILLTNDGELANRLTHPRYKVIKTYIAKVPGPVPREVVKQVRDGVELEDGLVKVDSFRVVDNMEPKALVEVQLHEGRKHIVRRLLDAVGHPVSDLARTQVGPIDLNTLKPGTMRALTAKEVSELYTAAGM